VAAVLLYTVTCRDRLFHSNEWFKRFQYISNSFLLGTLKFLPTNVEFIFKNSPLQPLAFTAMEEDVMEEDFEEKEDVDEEKEDVEEEGVDEEDVEKDDVCNTPCY
jgi:hypothetical protein